MLRGGRRVALCGFKRPRVVASGASAWGAMARGGRALCSSASAPKVVGASTFHDLSKSVLEYTDQIQRQIKLRGIDARERELAKELEAEDIWNDADRANKLSREHAALKSIINAHDEIDAARSEALEMSALGLEEEDPAERSAVLDDCLAELQSCLSKAEKFHVELLLDGQADNKGCFVEITAGAGGTESCDFAGMLLNMYSRWASNSGYKATVTETSPNEEAGYRAAVLRIDGHNAYGWVKAESGVHRMVRISEYDSNGRRQTCFAKVAVLPAVEDDDTDIDIPATDLKIEVFRASGAGGQHVNTTESAVRLTHLPTGIQAQSQDQRSQHQNRKLAMSVLKSRILQIKLEEEAAAKNKLANSLGENTWGNQIRSYVLHPYKMVKDHRTSHETSQAHAVLDGDPDFLTPFMQAHLVMSSADKPAS